MSLAHRLARVRQLASSHGLGATATDAEAALVILTLHDKSRSGDANARLLLEQLDPSLARDASFSAPSSLPAKPPHTTLSVGFVTPSLTSPGGAEDWVRAMVNRSVPGIHWSGVLCVNERTPEWRMPNSCPVVYGEQGARELDSISDLLVLWGIPWAGEPYITRLTTPIVVVSHGSGEWTRDAMWRSETWAVDRIGVSRPAASVFGCDATVLHNGVAPSRVHPRVPRHKIRERLGVAAWERLVGFYGRFSYEKAPLAPCVACSVLGEGWRSILVGDGWQREKVIEDALATDPNVIIHQSVELPGDILHAFDVFVLASPAEGFSLSMIEAWMAGVPVVATPVGAVPEVEEEFGPMVTRIPVDWTPDEIALAVRKAIGDRSRVEHAQAVALEHFTDEAMVARYAEHLKGLWDRIKRHDHQAQLSD